MGRLSLGNKSSPTGDIDQATPPPPYHDARQPPVIVTETTTTRTEVVTRTTETTTHFLSFPGWRKRSNVTYPSPQPSRHSGNVDEHGGHAMNSTISFREKALPPTPPEPPAPELLSPDMLDHALSNHDNIPHSARAFAHASLGSGPVHDMPQMSTSSSSVNEVNTVAFVSSTPSQKCMESTPGPRRSKSSQRVDRFPASTSPASEVPYETTQRHRVVSLGPASFLGLNGTEAKGKDKTMGPPKSLSRKSSFWNRKKPQNTDAQVRPATAHGDVSQRHPVVQVNLSDPPLDLCLSPLPSSRRQKLQARDPLSRSFSERPQSYYPTVSPEISTSPTTNHPKPTSRPSTADGPVSTAIGRLALSPTRTTAVSFSEASIGERLPLPRVRSQTNPPLLHRLSLNVFSSSTFLSASPMPSPSSPLLGAASDPLGFRDRSGPVVNLRPLGNEEPPDVYVRRLVDAISKIEVTSILASSAEPFYAKALKIFIGRFELSGDPLDIALRKLLLEIGLPKETQQIDRVMEAFAKRYIQCNPNLYVSEDHPYILAFSLIMLHTDAFNKSNKRKMTKPDYIKNTKLPGVAPEILEYLFDNIVFAPFIFIEDPLDFNGQRGLSTESNRRSAVFRDVPPVNSNHSSTGSTLAIKTNKIDPYYMIINNLLNPLRIDVESYIPLLDPFSYQGTAGKWDEEELLLAFANAHVIEVGAGTTRPTAFFGIAAGGSSSPVVPTNSGPSDIYHEDLSTLRVTRVGLMNRKDDLLEGGKKPLNRKWKTWCVVLTGSQLLFSRDPTWMNALLNRVETNNGQNIMPQSAVLRVDELLSVKNTIAVHDRSYTKHRFAFRLVLSDGRHLLLRASTEDDMNQWISRINYASAFKSAGVRMRLLGMSGKSMHLTGVAAATSHLHDLQNQIHSPPNDSARWDDNAPQELLEMLSGDESVSKRPHFQRKVTLRTNREGVELEAPGPLEAEKTVEFKDTFDQVKADLAAERWPRMVNHELALSLTIPLPTTHKGDLSPGSSSDALWQAPSNDHPRLPSRSQILEVKIAEIDDRLTTTESHLDTHMRFIRNVATLTPFQKPTRDRLVVAIQTRARLVMQLRLDIARMRCHRNVLRDDMVAENRIWKEVKDIALQAAKETLQSRQSPEIPQMTLSARETQRGTPSRPLNIQQRQSPESSICDSFHTAIDFGPDWPSSDDLGSSFLRASGTFDSPRPSTSGSFSSYRLPEAEHVSRVPGDVTEKGEEGELQQKYHTAQENPVEEAEAWNKTRCAHRVSLVKVPSKLELLPVGKRLTLSLSTTTEPD
ncbi:hypothetical protein P691DRAFT_803728 [Macrolepiota fuliginosa MF-IS2]|uniref:SEC7 domain-containing protein n=1 Tax=Macrolepiota fuliginosa MF-IS2 TaxID=1400762 RepID=A0A9P5XJM1_9AGAR|nr:hypothetical protein P691DRAFT_803728 [Macrolepiota fuliginosa MF-IS2]